VLIQQARARGKIDLVVSSRSMSGSGGKQSHSRSSGSDVSRERAHHVPDGVVLREKKSKSRREGLDWIVWWGAKSVHFKKETLFSFCVLLSV